MKAIGLAVVFAASYASFAAALTQGQCADAVVASCNKAFPNNYEGRIACVNNGLDTCDTLSTKPNREANGLVGGTKRLQSRN